MITTPRIGVVLANSRWTPRAWAAALAILAVGYGLSYGGFIPRQALLSGFWAPLYQLALYTVALRVFTAALGRAPRDVVLRGDDGLFWDRLFALSVFLLCVLPMMYLLSSRH